MVIATQNPVEFLGTYPLPEAQMDRFMMRLSIGYPSFEEEIALARKFMEGKTAETMENVLSERDVLAMREAVKKVHVSDAVLKYIRNIVAATREEERFVLGASPRATLFLLSASRARAFLEGRDFVKPDDVKAVAVNVLHHRLALTSEARIRKENIDNILKAALLKIKVPTE
jgi:MoxR-like ATPase